MVLSKKKLQAITITKNGISLFAGKTKYSELRVIPVKEKNITTNERNRRYRPRNTSDFTLSNKTVWTDAPVN
jgi:hypothetical protein